MLGALIINKMHWKESYRKGNIDWLMALNTSAGTWCLMITIYFLKLDKKREAFYIDYIVESQATEFHRTLKMYVLKFWLVKLKLMYWWESVKDQQKSLRQDKFFLSLFLYCVRRKILSFMISTLGTFASHLIQSVTKLFFLETLKMIGNFSTQEVK